MNFNPKNESTTRLMFVRGSVALSIFFAAVLVGSAVTQALNIAMTSTAMMAPFDLSANRAFAEEVVEGGSDSGDNNVTSSDDTSESSQGEEGEGGSSGQEEQSVSTTTDSEPNSEENNSGTDSADEENNTDVPAEIDYVIEELRTDEDSYQPGDHVHIEGRVNHVSSNNEEDFVSLSIIDPQDQKLIDEKELEVSKSEDGSGSFEYEFALSDDAQAGEYDVAASYVNSEETTRFDVIAPTVSEGSSEEERSIDEEDSEGQQDQQQPSEEFSAVEESAGEESDNNNATDENEAANQVDTREEDDDINNDDAVTSTPDADIEGNENNNNIADDNASSSDNATITSNDDSDTAPAILNNETTTATVAEEEPIAEDDVNATATNTTEPVIDPIIWTDKDDYSPGDTVVISGSGFSPESSITLKITHPDHGIVVWTSQSFSDGRFETTYRLDAYAEWYTVTATDEDSNQASVVFHDTPKVGTVGISSQSPSPVSAGGSATYTITVNRGTGSGSSGAFTASLSITSTLPSGVTASFASNTLSFSASENSKSTTLTLSTAAGSTPAGTHSFTVKAMRPDAPADTASSTGSLSVSAPADSTAPTTAASPIGGLYNSDQSVTLTANEPATIYYTTDGSTPTTSSTSGTSPISGISITSTTTLKFFARDTAGNTESVKTESYTIDKTGPIITVPDNIIAEATDSNGAIVEFDAPTSDDGSAVTCDYESGYTFPLGITTVHCEATDIAGNTGIASFTVTVQDTTAPTITVPDNIVAEAADTNGATVTYSVSASDPIDGDITPECSPESGSVFPLGETTVTCEATDVAGNSDSASFTVNVQDTSAPTLVLPDNIVTEATSSSGAIVSFTVTATDAVNSAEDLSITCDPESGSLFALGETAVECEVTDISGNSATGSFTVTVADTTAPVLTLPDDILKEATSSEGAIVEFTATAEDGVDGTILDVLCTPTSGATFAIGQTTVECEATDLAGNSAQGSFTVTVQDTAGPTITIPDNITVEATSGDGTLVEFAVTAEDAVNGAITVECSPASGNTFPLGTTTVECESVDLTGNNATASFTVTVQDTTSPQITVPETIVVEATSSSGASVEYSISASDAVDGDLSLLVECSPVSGSTFAIGSTEVSCEVTDSASNTGIASFTVTVQDTTAPTVTVPEDIIVEATSSDGAEVSFTASASDLVDGESLTADCSPASGSTFPLGMTTVTCEIADVKGNTASDTFTVTVQDTTAPVVTAPSNINAEASGTLTTIEDLGTASAIDAVDGPTAVTNDGPSSFPLGTTTVTYSSTDSAGNTGTAAQTVTITDSTAPSLTLPEDIVAEATSASGGSVSFAVTASDAVDGEELEFSCTYESGETFPIGTTTVECEATDSQGNSGSGSFTVTVRDTAAPIITVPSDITVLPTGASGAVVTYSSVTATDSVDSSPSVECTPASGSTFAIGMTTVNCSATDESGNTASKTFKVTVMAYTSNGFFKPVDMGSVINIAKGGSTVPLKFEVFAGTTEMTNTAVVKSYTQQKISCTSGPSDALGTLAMTGNTSLRYDTASGQFIANWKTPNQPNTCWKVTITLQGDNTISALFKLN